MSQEIPTGVGWRSPNRILSDRRERDEVDVTGWSGGLYVRGSRRPETV